MPPTPSPHSCGGQIRRDCDQAGGAGGGGRGPRPRLLIASGCRAACAGLPGASAHPFSQGLRGACPHRRAPVTGGWAAPPRSPTGPPFPEPCSSQRKPR